jgi:phage terminase large subunit
MASNKQLNEIELRAARQELLRRRQRAAKTALSYEPTPEDLYKAKALRDSMFPKQKAFFDDPATRKVGFCTRRAGKTIGTALHILATLLEHPRALVLYMAQTRDACKIYIWEEIRALVVKHDLPFDFNENSLTMMHRRGRGKCVFKGAGDSPKEMDKLRGPKWRLAVLDESGTFGAGMEDMVMSAIGPALRDENGTLILIGTAGRKREGLFYQAAHGLKTRKDGTPIYKKHQWSLEDNPFLSDQARDLEFIKEEEGLSDTDPRFLREYKMIWASADSERVWAGYSPDRNDSDCELDKKHQWKYLLGMDFGWQDASSIAVIAYSPTCKPIYVLETWQKIHAYSDEIAAKVMEFRATYGARRYVGDVGGQGKLHQMQLQRDYGIHIEAANKMEKTAYIEFMNSAFMRGEILIKKGDAAGKEFLDVVWNEDKTKVGNHEKDNAAHAAMYGWRAAKFAGAGKMNLQVQNAKINPNEFALREKLAVLNRKPIDKPAWWDNEANSRTASQNNANVSRMWRDVTSDWND